MKFNISQAFQSMLIPRLIIECKINSFHKSGNDDFRAQIDQSGMENDNPWVKNARWRETASLRDRPYRALSIIQWLVEPFPVRALE